ncbi:MAG: hypothetical protein IJP98_01615 [Clostridia bacterium]|nr:hypothetical protein [Clostridia bacterium]
MKRFGILVLVLLLTAIGCAQPASAPQNGTVVFVDPNAVKAGAYGDLYFTSKGYSFGIYDPTSEIFAHLTANNSFAEQSCAFDGEDVYYFFSGFEIMANVIDGEERVTAINIVDDTVMTPDGLYIGMPEADLCEALHCEIDDSGLYLAKDGTALRTVTVTDGTVRAISYLPAE